MSRRERRHPCRLVEKERGRREQRRQENKEDQFGTEPNGWRQLTGRNLRRALCILSRILWHIGWRSHYRRQFWPLCWTLLRRGDLEGLFQANIVAHHLISYTREALQGKGQASNYSLQQVKEMEQHSVPGPGHCP